MRKPSLFLLTFSLFVIVASALAKQQDYFVFNGKTLRTTDDNSAAASHTRWQVWLYQEGVHIPRHTAGLQYSRWGRIEENSAQSVMQRLKDCQSFEEAYLRFFGSGTWGRYTFFNPVGPIAVTDQTLEDQPALQKLYQLRWLHDRLNKVIAAVRPSLENNESEGPISSVREYFDQIRDALEHVGKLHSQLSHNGVQLRFISNGISRAKTEIAQAENNVPKITAVLPSVKLPTSKAWMSHAETGGSDGTIQVEVAETGSGVSVQQTWSGGDGSMTGTVITTMIRYTDIGEIDFEPPTRTGNDMWTIRVHSATRSFPQTVNSPRRKTGRGTFPPVNYTTTESSAYFVFLNSAEAQDAYAYFLYHKQLGR